MGMKDGLVDHNGFNTNSSNRIKRLRGQRSTELQVPAVLPLEIVRKKNTGVLSSTALLGAETLQVVLLFMIYSCMYLQQGPACQLKY